MTALTGGVPATTSTPDRPAAPAVFPAAPARPGPSGTLNLDSGRWLDVLCHRGPVEGAREWSGLTSTSLTSTAAKELRGVLRNLFLATYDP